MRIHLLSSALLLALLASSLCGQGVVNVREVDIAKIIDEVRINGKKIDPTRGHLSVTRPGEVEIRVRTVPVDSFMTTYLGVHFTTPKGIELSHPMERQSNG